MSAIRLEPLGEHHLDAVSRLVDDPEVQRFTRVPVPVPADFPRTWLERYELGRLDGTREAFAAVDADGALLGLAFAVSIERAARTAELGYVVAPWARGRGVATAALGLLTRWSFDELDLLRLELLIDAANGASRRVAERCGYVREGILRLRYVKPGVWADTEIWSRLAGDPAPGP